MGNYIFVIHAGKQGKPRISAECVRGGERPFPTCFGLFQGMFEKNILTFNPGWDSNANKLDSFTDVRQLQQELKAQGVSFETEADERTTGPASFVLVDPDGNPVLIDQHV